MFTFDTFILNYNQPPIVVIDSLITDLRPRSASKPSFGRFLKTCLYDDGVLNIRDLLRDGITDEDLKNTFLQVFKNRPKDGFEAERRRKSVISESMTTIGG